MQHPCQNHNLACDTFRRELTLRPLPPNYEIHRENFHQCLSVALKNRLDPNEIVLYEDDDEGDNIMWAVVGMIRRYAAAPRILKALLDHGGNPNLEIGFHEMVFSKVDDFFWIDGETLPKCILPCWLLAAYGGDQDNIDYLPLTMLNGHSMENLKQYENYAFSFETVASTVTNGSGFYSSSITPPVKRWLSTKHPLIKTIPLGILLSRGIAFQSY